MQSQIIKIILAVFITAIVASGGTYYFLSTNKIESAIPATKNTNKENVVFNQSSKEYAAMGSELWSAFSCSTWASHFGNQKEAERLFIFGYEQGKKFLGAARTGKITDEDFRQEVPIGISMSLAGPNDDFVLGVIFTNIQENALEEVFYTNYDKTKLNSEDLQKSIAENKYRDGNCKLIGK
jgi:hypothetical protein